MLQAITEAFARRKGLFVIFDGRSKLWQDGDRILMANHSPCAVCGRQTRWRVLGWIEPCCSRACFRTRYAT